MNTNLPIDKSIPDPFGRLATDDGSQDRFKNLSDIFNISSAVGPSDANDPDDVARVEILMDHLGELNLGLTDGPTGYYGERLKQAISAFQTKSGLPATGRIAVSDSTMAAVQRTMASEQPSQNQQRTGIAQEAEQNLAINQNSRGLLDF